MAFENIIGALPPCGPNEPVAKHYVLKKTTDYIQFLEDKIAELCSEMDITHSTEHGHFSFSEPLHVLIDGCQHVIAANTPVTLETLDKLLDGLNFKVSKSKSGRLKGKSSKKKGKENPARYSSGTGESRCEDYLVSREDGEIHSRTEVIDSTEPTESTAFQQENLLDQDTSSRSMICSESLSDLDTSGVSQIDSSTSSNCGAETFDDGFSSCKTSEKESSQSQDSYGSNSKGQSTDLLPDKEESLADLIKCGASRARKKYIPTKIRINQGNSDVLDLTKTSPKQLDGHSWKPTGKVPVQCVAQSHSQLLPPGQLHSLNQGVGMSLLTVPTGSGRLLSQQNLGAACIQVQPNSSIILPNISSPVALAQNVEQRAHTNIQAFPSNSMPMPSYPPNNILNQTLSNDYDSSPTFGFINCTLTHGPGSQALSPGNSLTSLAASQPFQYYQQQKGSLFQSVRHTVEIILDVGSDPALVESYCDCELSSRRSPLNGYQLFSKVNQRKFRDGWPPLKSREITRLIAQAWQEIPGKFKILFSQRASEWNRWHRAQRKENKSLLQ